MGARVRQLSGAAIARSALPLAVAVVINLATDVMPGWFRPWQWLAWPVAVVLVFFVVWTEARRGGNRAEVGDEIETGGLDQAANRLAVAVRLQWTDEASLRGLLRPRRLQLTWSSTVRPVSASASAVLMDDGVEAHRARLRSSGDLTDLADRFHRLPSRQLVVLGEPGAGKSVLVLLLTLDLLDRRRTDDPLPVLISLASWDPRTEHLQRWLASRLAQDHPYLARADSQGRDVVGQLLSTGRILPILDGLDELPVELRPAAIAGLDRAVAGGQPFVVTCRTAEYEASVEAREEALSRAAVVEISSVKLDHAIAFLGSAGAPGASRWGATLSQLAKEPDSPLAGALRTPLMVALAQSAYARANSDPAELLDANRFPDQSSVELHLLDSFLPAVYHDLPPRPSPAGTPPRRYQLTQVRNWLEFLATRMNERGTPNLAWWELRSGFRRPRLVVTFLAGAAVGTAVLVTLLTLGMANGLPTWTADKIRAALLADLLLAAMPAAVATVVVGLTKPRQPNRAGSSLRHVLNEFGDWIRRGRATILLTAALALGMVAVSRAIPEVEQAVIGFLTIPGPISLIISAVVVPSLIAGRFSHRPIDVTAATDPVFVLRSDRTAALTAGFLGGIAAGIGIEVLMLVYGSDAVAQASIAPTIGVMAGSIMILNSAWGNYQLVRIWHAIRGELPLSMTSFLADAHRRGVLRQNGASYQFRHLRLQEYLGKTRNHRGSGP